MRTYKKTLYRLISNNISRFISLTLIMALGVCFVTGVAGITPKINNSFHESLDQYNIADTIIKTNSKEGIKTEVIDKIKSNESVSEYSSYSVIDSKTTIEGKEKNIRLQTFNNESNINKLILIDGVLPTSPFECVLELPSDGLEKHSIGDTIYVLGMQFKIVGIVSNPLIFSKLGDVSVTINENGDLVTEMLDSIIYINSSTPIPLPITNIDIIFNKYINKDRFNDKYFTSLNLEIEKLNAQINDTSLAFLTLKDNLAYGMMIGITEKIDIIALIFPAFFIFVVSLVGLTTMTRLIEENRSQIGCLKSLGYSNHSIRFQYVLFALSSTLIGAIVGLSSGVFIIPNIVYGAFQSLLYLPKMSTSLFFTTGAICAFIMITAVLIVTLVILFQNLNTSPKNLLLPKSPKVGKKIIFERIPFIWNNLKFKYKSTARNILRYKGRLIMVICSTAGSTALVMTGLGLFDSSSEGINISGIIINIRDSIGNISIAIIIFALLLSVLVLYNLTNMNIEERKREIASLKVLGYKNTEVFGYIFREIFIMCLFGIIIGTGLGVGLLVIIFDLLELGTISMVGVPAYIGTIIISIIFILIVDVMLIKKIKNIDMNDSLKSIE
ncbi:MAG: ABC transporter permease [Anaeroplasmataceae bacterium]